LDECLIVGDGKAIKDVIKGLKSNGFTLKDDGTLMDYLSCEVSFAKNGKQAWIHQPHLIKKMENKFGPMLSKMQQYGTPGTPRGVIVKDDKSSMSKEDQKL
jgi:hypothetical protein